MFLIGTTPQKGSQKREPLLLQFFRYIQSSGVVVGDDSYRLAIPNRIGDNIQNGLCLSGTGRPLDDTDLGGKGVLHRCFLALVQTKGVNDCLREHLYGGLLRRIQIAGQHGCIADTFDPLILGAQDVEAAFGYQADRRCCFFEVFKNARLLLVLQAVFLEFHLAF